MEKAELIKRLNGYEWNDVEFKEARRAVPKNAYETVSAFSNTGGGWLVFGIRDGGGGFEIVGVLEVDKVQNDFLGALRSGQKLNRVIAANERLIEEDGKALLVFHIPEARRQDKPVYLNNDIRRSFLRRGAGDERCTPAEIERLLRDATDERHDGEAIDLDPGRCFDDGSLRWYRKLFDDRNPGQDTALSHLEFLHHWGLVVEVGGRLSPTRAAILLFGAAPAFRQMLPRPVVDWQWSRGDWSEDLSDERWADRLVIETNLVETWRTLVDRFLQRAEKPFSVDPETLRREDRPPDYIAFREAVINLLMHQDYADHTRKPTIQFFDDRTILWNPGDAFESAEELLNPGVKEVRNPRIVAAFRRIGLSEQAGTGIRAIVGNWRRLGRVPPIIDNDRARKAFQLILAKEELLSEEQLLFQASLGIRLDEAEAKAFAFACREGRLYPRDVGVVTGLSGAGVQAVLERLVVQNLVAPIGDGETSLFSVAEHLKGRLGQLGRSVNQTGAGLPDLVTDQVPKEQGGLSTAQAGLDSEDLSTAQDDSQTSTTSGSVVQPLPAADLRIDAKTGEGGTVTRLEAATKLSTTQEKIVRFCDTPRRLAEIMDKVGVASRGYFKKRHLDPLLQGGVLRMVYPDQSNHPHQAYVLTEAGIALKARSVNRDAGAENRDRTNGA